MTERIETLSEQSRQSYVVGLHLVLWPLLAATAAVVLYLIRGLWSFPVVVPALAIALTAGCFVLVLIGRGENPMFQFGGLFGSVVALYGLYPMVTFVINDGVISSGQDDRLHAYPPTIDQFASVGWWHFAFLAAFCLSYLATTRNTRHLRARKELAPTVVFVLLTLAIIAIEAEVSIYGLLFNMNPKDYVDSYLVVQKLPTIPRQIYSVTTQLLPTLQLLLLGALFARYRTRRLWIAVLLLLIFLPVLQGGSRAPFFVAMFAAAMFYHYQVRPIPVSVVAIGGTVALTGFMLLGLVRQQAAGVPVSVRHFTQSSTEFEVLFANVYDLRYIRHADGLFIGHPELYLSDLVALVPQQLVPFNKTSPSLWYLDMYYPRLRDRGAGLAFGVISQGVVGHGWSELVVLGVMLGVLFGMVQRIVTLHELGYWGLTFYVWLTVTSYNSFRNTAFSLVPLALYRFLLPVVAVILLHWLITPFKRNVRNQA